MAAPARLAACPELLSPDCLSVRNGLCRAGRPLRHTAVPHASGQGLIQLRLPAEVSKPTAVALGSFDGLHRGHRRVIDAITSDPAGAVPSVVSFWPHPREVLFGERRLRINLPEEKLALLEPLGIEQLVLVPFNRDLARLTPAAFVDRMLVEQLQARVVAVGANFRFGVDRCGDVSTLQALAAARGIRVDVAQLLNDDGSRISSSRIRQALAAGNLEEAARLMPRPYHFSGRVGRGRGLGKGLGWPTANLAIDGRKCLPRLGVYAAWARLDGRRLPAVMNLGPQPTVDPAAPSAVEVHLLDQTLELLGRLLEVEPVRYLRGQVRFDGLDSLRTQIACDADRARTLLSAV
ncbi:MAG: bifunctional riboflavin kinase/FAD synthetase [Aphanocapsa feldmannii 277cV]|uniref:Riboflavin biosynthesis protein n=2 Tax=Aphanocapsa feldmannii TaxID=192050 RepID=A0A524RR39_9CHRO|nr:MAG: bifunctional riboflavin kinase/FAD synthetase [Aphanocapsa feldmannii 277cV]TGH19940.1 MAG: bifunctional riboflavin kinase/FAD synthetase [Aphanocapsa feldmannii 277cI]